MQVWGICPSRSRLCPDWSSLDRVRSNLEFHHVCWQWFYVGRDSFRSSFRFHPFMIHKIDILRKRRTEPVFRGGDGTQWRRHGDKRNLLGGTFWPCTDYKLPKQKWTQNGSIHKISHRRYQVRSEMRTKTEVSIPCVKLKRKFVQSEVLGIAIWNFGRS